MTTMSTDDTVTVSAAEFHRDIVAYQDIALTKPVTVTKNGRERTVLLSAQEYARLKRRDRVIAAARSRAAARHGRCVAT
jgi:PHD/YefM family antitoxin component YafN of YafNO toxin-antitoxin module